MEYKGLTFSVVFEAMSLNYGESTGNVSELKKLARNSEMFSYMSRQALRYEIYNNLKEMFNIDSDKEEPLAREGKENSVIQFKPEANIRDYVELDLFGYMKTKSKEKDKENKKKSKKNNDNTETQDDAEASADAKKNDSSVKRTAPVRIMPAISLEPMRFDIEFGTNLNFAERTKSNPNLFQMEQHLSLYVYTITIELDRIGIDPNDNIVLDNHEKARRINMLLNALMFLKRNIHGRMENLSPLFVIGGAYPFKNPFFLGRIKAMQNAHSMKYMIDTNILKDILQGRLKDDTYIGLVKGYWENEDEISNLLDKNHVLSVPEFFTIMYDKVSVIYGVKS